MFHQAFFGPIGVDSAVDFAWEIFQIIFSPHKKNKGLHIDKKEPQMYLILL